MWGGGRGAGVCVEISASVLLKCRGFNSLLVGSFDCGIMRNCAEYCRHLVRLPFAVQGLVNALFLGAILNKPSLAR